MDAMVGALIVSVVGAATSAAGYLFGRSRSAATPPSVVLAPEPEPEPEAAPAPVESKAPEEPRADTSAMRAMIENALAEVERAAEHAKALELSKSELQRQLDVARRELKNEVLLRAGADARAEELADRLARASEEAASLRHRVNVLDRQTKSQRESGKALPAAGDLRMKRNLEEAEEMRAKLRDVVEKLERASLPPAADVRPPPDDSAVLREEIARLAAENRNLRAQALGSLPAKPPREGAPDIDLAIYESVIQRLSRIAGISSAVLADDVGNVILGRGDLAENLAAFGAYILDASSRTEGLLPLESVEEVALRDAAGMRLSTRIVQPASGLSVVFLANAETSVAAAKKVFDDQLQRRGQAT